MKYTCDTCGKEILGWRNPNNKHFFCCKNCHDNFIVGNKIIIKEGFAIMLVKTKNRYLKVIIDKEDISKVQQYTWHAKYQEDIHSYYVETNQKLQSGKFMLMLHRFLTDTTCKSKTVDHINHDTLDNRKCNLKVCSQKENNLNQAELHKNNKTGYRNISYQKMYDKFIVTLMINGKNKTIGRTSSLKEAILMRDKAKRQYGVSNVYNFTRLSNKCK